MILLLFFSLSGMTDLAVGFSSQQTATEKSKIEFLLKEVEKLDGAKFWRNGSSYSAKAAADHLRMKWEKAGRAIKTAKDFIEKIGSESSVSGKPYQIEFKDGKKINTSVFFHQKLAAWKP
ncbi:MAG: DUF5329 family protein [Bacteroidetes bacterium]|nr:DUF5329 family protein [Bacteroidota bacterium]